MAIFLQLSRKVLAGRFLWPKRNDYCSSFVETVKSSQKIFTDSEVSTLTGICVEHVHNFAKTRHLGFIARAAEAAGINADQWLFTLSDLMVIVTLFPKCTH